MQTIETLKPSVLTLDKFGIEYALLECTNLYPSPPDIVSLKGVIELKKTFPKATIGFSDHSIGPEMALASIALGACIIERHFTDTRYRKGPDIICSMDPAELKFLIDRSKEVHKAILNPKKRYPNSEKDVDIKTREKDRPYHQTRPEVQKQVQSLLHLCLMESTLRTAVVMTLEFTTCLA